MQYNFDEVIDRKSTEAVKWADLPGIPHDALPLWVADMDFVSPKEVVDALRNRVDHGVFGYPLPQKEYFTAIMQWMKERHNWQIERHWIVPVSGVVPAMHMAIRAFVKPGDKVIIQRPVYPPFSYAIERNGVHIVNNPLKQVGDRFEIDFEDFENKAKDPQVKMFLLCNPHNPVGRVWTKEELERIGEICLRHNVLVFADEIHQDIVYQGYKHIPFASISPQFSSITITATAPSKTFNIAGLKDANLIIENEQLRGEFNREMERNGLSGVNLFGLIATTAAYTYGKEWLDQLLVYLEGNRDYCLQFINERLPQLKAFKPEATYLLWIDCRKLGMDPIQLREFMLQEAKLRLNEGYIYGGEGNGFMRLNFACPRSLLEKAMDNLEKAIRRLSR